MAVTSFRQVQLQPHQEVSGSAHPRCQDRPINKSERARILDAQTGCASPCHSDFGATTPRAGTQQTAVSRPRSLAAAVRRRLPPTATAWRPVHNTPLSSVYTPARFNTTTVALTSRHGVKSTRPPTCVRAALSHLCVPGYSPYPVVPPEKKRRRQNKRGRDVPWQVGELASRLRQSASGWLSRRRGRGGDANGRYIERELRMSMRMSASLRS